MGNQPLHLALNTSHVLVDTDVFHVNARRAHGSVQDHRLGEARLHVAALLLGLGYDVQVVSTTLLCRLQCGQ